MNSKIVRHDELQDFVENLHQQDRWAISVESAGEDYLVKWTEHKKYVSYTGDTHPDEVWRTKEGNIMCVQDMDPEHARNALRMMLRAQRLLQEALLSRLTGLDDGDDSDDDFVEVAEEGDFVEVAEEDDYGPYYHGKKPTIQ